MSKKNKQQTNEADVIVEEVAVEETVEPTVEEKPKKQKAAFQSENIKVEEKKQKVVADKNTNKKKKGENKPNIFVRMGKGAKNTFSELKRVTWPKPKEVFKNSLVVLIVVLIFFLILLLIDFVLGGLLSLLLTGNWTNF